MPLNPNIILSGQPAQIKSPAELQMDRFKLKQAQQAITLNDQAIAKNGQTAPTGQSEQEIMQQIVQEAGGDPHKIPEVLLKRGMFKEAVDFVKGWDAHEEQQRKLSAPPAAPEQVKPIAVQTIDEQGNPITKFVVPEAGASYPTVPKVQSSNAPNVGSFEDYVLRTYGDKPTPAQVLKARKDYMQADDRPLASSGGGAAGGGVSLTPGAVDYAASQVRLTNNMAILNRLDDNDRKTILNRIDSQVKALGQTPASAIQKQFAMKADGASLTQVTKLKSSAEAFENKAIAQTDLIKNLSAKVSRTSWPFINSAIISGKTNITGDENASKLVNAVTTFAAEYAKIMEGSTGSAAGSSDAARRASEKLVSAAMNQKTLPAVLDQMKWEMRQTGVGYDATIAAITERMGGGTPAAPAAAGTVEKWVRDKNGKLVKQ